jgi:very-short-patch-repair endonuclease
MGVEYIQQISNNKVNNYVVKTSKLQLNIAQSLHINEKYINYKVGPYYADIVIPNQKVIVEVNGAIWHKDKAKDIKRAKYLVSQGYKVLIIQIYSGQPDSKWIRHQIRKLLNYKKKSILYVEYP